MNTKVCKICDETITHIGPSLLVEGTELWLHETRGITSHLPTP
jgi:hypothetical protein